MKLLKLKLVLLACLGLAINAQAQTTTQTLPAAKPGVRITSTARPLKPLSEQIAELERMLEQARQDPNQVANGTVAKYEAVLARKKEELAAEEKQD